MKQRYAGRVSGDDYEILMPDGGVAKTIPIVEADSKLRAAIARNGWEAIPEE